MPDLGPSLDKLRRDWRDSGDIETPNGMITRRVLDGMVRTLAIGEVLQVERVSERRVRIRRAASMPGFEG
jgi:hypothetical protein